MAGPYHTDTFDNIPEEKRERILRAAADVLGRDGISGARMGDIAGAAGISHGSLFSYFPTKDHLVRAVVARGLAMEGERFGASEDEPFPRAVEGVVARAWETAEAEAGLISLWLSLSLVENGRFADDILVLEADAAERWRRLAERGLAEGRVKAGSDPRVVAFLLDAVVAQLMKSRASELERRKLDGIFPGVDDPPGLILRELFKLLA
jgi:AcrR family transcriptional regulator